MLRFVRAISPVINEHASCCRRSGKVPIDPLGMRPTSEARPMSARVATARQAVGSVKIAAGVTPGHPHPGPSSLTAACAGNSKNTSPCARRKCRRPDGQRAWQRGDRFKVSYGGKSKMETRSYMGVEYMRSGALVLLREMAHAQRLQSTHRQAD